jgi:hypothetical protein
MSTAAGTSGPCPYCGQHHTGICPMVKAIEYFENGTVKRVEFKTPSDYMPTLPQWVPGPITCGEQS